LQNASQSFESKKSQNLNYERFKEHSQFPDLIWHTISYIQLDSQNGTRKSNIETVKSGLYDETEDYLVDVRSRGVVGCRKSLGRSAACASTDPAADFNKRSVV
jgi:hypothetical protein